MKVTKERARAFIVSLYEQDDPRSDEAVQRALEAADRRVKAAAEKMWEEIREASEIQERLEAAASKLAKVRAWAEEHAGDIFHGQHADLLAILDGES